MKIVAGSKTWESAHIEWMDWILIIGLTLAPMTGLRIWKVGPAEVLCLLWGARFLFRSKSLKSGLFLFFVSFLLALGAGAFVGYFVAPNELSRDGLLTWIYLAVIAISLYEGLKAKSLEYNETLFFTFAEIATLWNLFLFLYSRLVRNTLFGAPLWYHSVRFSGGGTNPHQIAVLLCGLIFVFLRCILKREKTVRSVIFLAVCVYLLLQTESSTGVLAIALGLLISLYFFIADLFPRRKFAALLVLTLIIALTLLIFGQFFYQRFMDWVAEDRNGMGRIGIFASFGESFIRSPLFGLGPGTHGRMGSIEFHNTYLEILAATGVVGGVVLIVYSISLFKTALKAEWNLFPILVAMYAYGLAGFAMRRLVYWGLIAFVSVIAEQIVAAKQNQMQLHSMDNTERYSDV